MGSREGTCSRVTLGWQGEQMDRGDMEMAGRETDDVIGFTRSFYTTFPRFFTGFCVFSLIYIRPFQKAKISLAL